MKMHVLQRGKSKRAETPPELQFVKSVRVRRTRKQLSRRQRLLVWFWALMTVKCALAHWAIIAWNMPVGPFWVWMPSIFAGITCTVAFLTCE